MLNNELRIKELRTMNRELKTGKRAPHSGTTKTKNR
jgi:hypothetical protein